MNDEITMIINTLCEKLGVAAGMLIPEMARYCIVRLVAAIIMLALAAVFFGVKAKRAAKRVDPEDPFDDLAIFLAGISAITSVAAAVCLIELSGWIASPVAATIERIAAMFGG